MNHLVVTPAQKGQSVALQVGERLTLMLPENASTGYAWAFAALDETCLVVEGTSYDGAGSAVGSSALRLWEMRALAPGDTTVALKLWRPWEGDVSIAERFEVKISIR